MSSARKRLGATAALLALSLAVTLTSCDVGGGDETALPAGDPTTAPPGDKVLYVALAQQDRVFAYRLGTDGLLPAQPFSSIDLENPRRVLLDADILYVALEDRVVAMSLATDGSLPTVPDSQTNPVENAEGIDLLLFDGILYAAFENLSRVNAYVLENGQLPPEPASSSGTAVSDYRSMAIADGFLYAASLAGALIDTYVIQPDGTLPAEPEAQVPETEIFRPEDMLARDGILYVVTQSRERIHAYRIRANGLLPEEYDSRTSARDIYARLLLDEDRLYASGFSEGRIDLYLLEPDGMLPLGEPFARTAPDTAAFPLGMVLDGGILYVAQAGIGRVDAYILNADGSPAEFPSSSTDTIPGSFPTEIAIGTFPD